ncbi:MAG: hypothetical protein WB392_02165 [Methanotrichaceae archaeon]
MDLNTIRQAEAARIIKDYNPLYNEGGSHSATDLGITLPESTGSDVPDAVNMPEDAAQKVNVR